MGITVPTESHRAVLVTDGNERSALAVTRSLGQHGVAVYVGAETTSSLAGCSRYCVQSFVYPPPMTRPDDYVACLINRANEWGASVVFPMTDVAVEVIGEHHERVGTSLILPIPSLAQYRALSNKYQLMAEAKQRGVPIPETIFVPDGDIERVLSEIVDWPVVIKPGRSLIYSNGQWQKTSVHYAHNAESLRRLYSETEYLQEPSLLQSRVIGEGQGVFGLFDHGKPLALFAHRRIRERPPSGGVSVLRESMPLTEPITDYALRVVQAVEWHGVAMVEFKVDKVSQVPYLMEVNGRFWGSLQLAIDAGLDFPWLLYQLGTTGSIPSLTPSYQVGVKSRWWMGDLDHLLLRLRKSNEELSLPPGSPSRSETIKMFLWGKDREAISEVFRLSDILPGLFEARTYGLPLLRRVRASLKARARHARVLELRMYWDLVLAGGVRRMMQRSRFPRDVRRVLVLCKGNICRSPFAAELLKMRALGISLPLEVVSAGLDTTPGHDAYPLAKTTSRGYGIDLRCHRTTPITSEMVAWADLIIVMEVVHILMLKSMFPSAASKTFLLGHFAVKAVTEIDDPYGGNADDFIRCYAIIADGCDGLLVQIGDRPHLLA